MAEHRTYAVYFHPQALDVLGDAIKPHLSESPAGQYIACTEIDTAGSFCELTISGTTADGKPLDYEVFIPTGMIRLVISMSGTEVDFGFG